MTKYLQSIVDYMVYIILVFQFCAAVVVVFSILFQGFARKTQSENDQELQCSSELVCFFGKIFMSVIVIKTP